MSKTIDHHRRANKRWRSSMALSKDSLASTATKVRATAATPRVVVQTLVL